MAEKVRSLPDGSATYTDGSWRLRDGSFLPSHADIDSQDTPSALNIRSRITRHKTLFFAGVLAGIGVGTFAAVSGGSAEASDDRTQYDSHSYNPDAVRQIDDVTQNPLDNPLVPDINAGFGNLDDEGINYVLQNSQPIIDNLDNTLPFPDSPNSQTTGGDGGDNHSQETIASSVARAPATSTSQLNAEEATDYLDGLDGARDGKISLKISENSSVDQEIQELTGTTPEESWGITVGAGLGDKDLVHPGQVIDGVPTDEAGQAVIAADAAVIPDSDGAAPQVVIPDNGTETPSQPQPDSQPEPVSQPVADPNPEPTAAVESSGQTVVYSGESECLSPDTDLKGNFEITGNHIAQDPVTGKFENVQPSERQACPNYIYIRSFASDQKPESPGWLQNQTPITSQIKVFNPDGSITLTSTAEGRIEIPDDTGDLKVEVDVPMEQVPCAAQVEAVRTDEINPEAYNGDKMIHYAFVINPNVDPETCLPLPTPTPEPTPTATPEPTLTATPTPTPTPVECIPTDLKGRILYDENRMVGDPVRVEVENVQPPEREACPDVVWLDVYGSPHTEPEGPGWLESQEFVKQFEITVKTGKEILEFEQVDADFCSYQWDLLRTPEQKKPPYFAGDEMIDSAFDKDEDCQVTPTPTVTATPSPSPSPSPTPTPTQVPEGPSALPPTGSQSGSENGLGMIPYGAIAMTLGLGAMGYELVRRRKLARVGVTNDDEDDDDDENIISSEILN